MTTEEHQKISGTCKYITAGVMLGLMRIGRDTIVDIWPCFPESAFNSSSPTNYSDERVCTPGKKHLTPTGSSESPLRFR